MAGGGKEIVDVKYDRVKIDDEAYKSVLFQFGAKEVWLPRSLIEIDRGDMVVTMPTWKAEQEDITEFVV